MSEEPKIVVVNKDEITLPEAITFYKKYKNVIWGAVIALASITGTNVDRIGEFIPDGLIKDSRVDGIITRVEALEKKSEQPANIGPVIRDAIKESLTRDYNKDN